MPINLFDVSVSSYAKDKVVEVLNSGWLNEGEVVVEFEKELQKLGLDNPITTNSCTSALHLSLICSGIKEGDEVILPPQTFIATGLVVLMVGATPVFADIDPKTGNICPESIKSKITKNTKAIIAVHWGGRPCNMIEILDIAEKYDLTVIEDAAHAFGAIDVGKVKNNKHYICFSFQSIKMLTTGDGGAVCCNNPEQIRTRRWFGIDKSKCKKTFDGSREFDISVLGYKYHMNNIAAAIGLGNLISFPEQLKRRKEIAKIYSDNIKYSLKYDEKCCYWIYPLIVEDRDFFIKKMNDAKISCSTLDLGIYKNSIFGNRSELPGQKYFDEHQINIPIHPNLDDEDINTVITTIGGL